MTRIEELAQQILIEMKKIGANRPKVDISAYKMPDSQSAAEVVRKALGHEPKVEERWCEARRGRVNVSVFFENGRELG